MSDTNQSNSPQSGDNRRRRSRGGQNRRSNNNRGNSEGRQPNGRQSGGGNRSGSRQNSGKPQRRPMPAPPAELTFWQKLLKAIGLYKEPVRPPRPERRPDKTKSDKTREPRKQKTRDVRSSSDHEENSSGEKPRRKRRERGERDTNRPRGGDPSTVANRRVYVGNLSYDVTESDLEELFKGVGAVRRVEIVYNRSTHRSKGYGFIEMVDIDEAKRTVEVLHDQFFMGRKLTVSGAKSKDHEEAEAQDEINQVQNSEVPPLASKNPAKEEVTSLIDEAPKPKLEIAAEENLEVPTEEFSPAQDTPEPTKEQA